MINLTETAQQKIREILSEESDPATRLRAFVQGGGCSGFQYAFILDDQYADDDFEIDGMLVDAMSMQYLAGSTIDWRDDIMGSQFVISNPNATTTCGCGSSFSYG